MGASITVQDLSPELRPLPQAGVAQLELTDVKKRCATVLVVEDDADVRELMCRVLEMHGYMVLSAASAEEGIRIFEEHDGAVHVLLTDVTMPGMSGFQLARELGERSGTVKAIFISGYDREPECNAKWGECAYLQKPFTLETLTRKVREVIDGTKYPAESRRVN